MSGVRMGKKQRFKTNDELLSTTFYQRCFFSLYEIHDLSYFTARFSTSPGIEKTDFF